MNSESVVFITGASSGIGAALAREYVRLGCDVVLVARRLDRLSMLESELKGSGRRILSCAADVTRDGDLERVVEIVRSQFGRIDTAIANAGFGVTGDVESLELADYRRQFETNVFGVLRTVKAVLPELKKSKGRLGIVGSVNGFLSLPGGSPYGMSKFAVRALCESLSKELSIHDISVTHIAPGFVESEIRQVDNQGVWHAQNKDRVPRWIQMPAERAAQHIAKAVIRRKRQVIVTGHGKFIAFMSRHFPGFVSLLISGFRIRARLQP